MDINIDIDNYYGYMGDFVHFFTQTLPIIIFGFAFLDIILLIIDGSLKKKNDKMTKEIHIDAIEPAQLAAALAAMGYPKNKNSGVDSDGKAFIKGKYGIYTFENDENGVAVTYDNRKKLSRLGEYFSKHKRYRRSCEALVIKQWLYKHLDPTSPVDCRSKYRNLKTKDLLDRLPLTLVVLSVVAFFGCYFYFESLHKTVNSIRYANPEKYNYSYNTVLDGYLDDLKWDYYDIEDGKKAVNAKGKAKYAFDGKDIIVQFVFDDKGDDFEVYAVEIDGSPISDNAIICLLYEMFENYKNKDNTSAFDSVDTLEEIASELYYSDEDDIEYDEDVDAEVEKEQETTKPKTTTTTTTTVDAEPDPEDLYNGPDTIIYHPDAILGYWHYAQSEDGAFCFNADGTMDEYERYRGEDEFTYIGSYNYHIEGNMLYIERRGSTTGYMITFEGPSKVLADEMSQGVYVYTFEWVRGSELEE